MRKTIVLAMLWCSTYSAMAQRIDSAFVEANIAKLRHARKYTLQVAALMPDSLYHFTPSPEEMSFGKQLVHIAQNLGWLSATYISKSSNPLAEEATKAVSKKEVEATVSKAYDFAISALQHLDPLTLTDTASFFAGPMSKLQIINLIEDHQTHHRGQLLVYLRLNGIKPPDYIGW